MFKYFKLYALYLSIGLFFVSLWLPCYHTPDDDYYGFSALWFGWRLIGMGVVGTGWLANPLLFIAWVINKPFPALSILFAAIAFAIALCVPFLTSVHGVASEVFNYKVGYWLWLASYTVLLCGSFAKLITETKQVIK